ncbi:hypothetical protein NIES267_65690 [Calothrix parasitica NIES-267]|uniref:DUF11 domain-containing protein n=1 Tax=Calothrix parasitica NIES-267 TaxID=1973488 RepID=A0A1Z4M105_9CYAN|nr:hypothetical protein NIES267_65690 [Calothrix parasitica NIES-267]
MKSSIKPFKSKLKSKLIRSVALLFTTCSYQSLLLIGEANFSQVSAQVARVCAVPGKDGPVDNVTGIINTYFPGTADVAAGSTTIPIGTPTGAATPIEAGDLLLVIQMQGADIDSSNTDSYGDGVAGGSTPLGSFVAPDPTGASGNLNNANFIAGNYEYVVAEAVNAGSVTIRGTNGGGLINSYSNAAFGTQGQRTYQVIRVPQYSSATINSGLTASRWNGSTGGVLVYDVAGNLNLGGANVDLSGRGFRGGGGRQLQGEPGNTTLAETDFRSSSTLNTNGSKGEGTAGTPRFKFDSGTNTLQDTGPEGYPDGASGRGAPGNAGGGGTDGDPQGDFRFPNGENTGGGGGGNGGGGGLGGRSFSSQEYIGGFGGASFPATNNRLVLGGGGGAGTTNDDRSIPLRNGLASSGAAGGGMAFIRTGTVSGTGSINADGASAFDTRVDGAGGGGAGGSVVVSAVNNNLAGLTVTANGGTGGNALAREPHGPGGGGGGGVIITSPGANTSAVGGTSGQTSDPLEPFGATAGSNGTTSNVGNINGVSSGAECLPQLTITKTTSTPGPIIKPGQATYTVTVANAPNLSAATNVNISDPLPSGFTFDASVNPTITLNGGSTRTSISNPPNNATVATFGTFNIPSGGSVAITFTSNISENVPNGEYNNPATATYLDPTRTTPDGTTNVNYDAATLGEEVLVGSTVPTEPERLRGLKRITNVFRNGVPISGIDFNSFLDNPNDPIDNLPSWFQLSPVGIFNISPQLPLQTGDEVEYTMYFLADGNRPVENVRFCDPIPQGTTFVPDSFGSGNGISINLSNTVTANTNSDDGDNGSFFAPGSQLPANNFCPNQDNPTGAVIGNLGTINHTLGTNFGFVRFRVRVE